MFLLDSLMISGLRWVLNTVTTAAEAEMNDDTALREQLLDAEMRRETGEISDTEFEEIEADLLARIREIRNRRGESGLVSTGPQPIETTAGGGLRIEASVAGDFHEVVNAPHTTIIESGPHGGERISVLDIEPGPAEVSPVPPVSRARPRKGARRIGKRSRRTLRKS